MLFSRVLHELVGSLAGIMRLDQPELDFAATDVPLAASDLKRQGREQFPIVMGGIAVVAKLDGVESGALRLNGAVSRTSISEKFSDGPILRSRT